MLDAIKHDIKTTLKLHIFVGHYKRIVFMDVLTVNVLKFEH